MTVTQFKPTGDYKYPTPTGVSLAQIAASAGLNKSTVSRVLRGDADGTDGYEKVMEALKVLGGSSSEAASEPTIKPVAIQGYSRGQLLFQAMLEATQEDREFTVLVGPSGADKTHCVRLFAADNPEVLLMQAQQRMSVGDLLNGLCRLALPPSSVSATKSSMTPPPSKTCPPVCIA